MSGPKRPKPVAVHGSSPEICLLSNGRYSVMFTASGGGYSTWRGWTSPAGARTPPATAGASICYVRDLDDGRAWSAGRQPLGRNADDYEAELRPDRAISAAATATSRPARGRGRPRRRRRKSAGSP